uniref:Uncharacterized protein n=1 Tax=Glossina palpalis gambiensis TaxID=67801 RepID=A0A1B0B6F9_9MUSC
MKQVHEEREITITKLNFKLSFNNDFELQMRLTAFRVDIRIIAITNYKKALNKNFKIKLVTNFSTTPETGIKTS